MDDFSREALHRLPLAEACLRLWHWLCSEKFLSGVFQQFRGRTYENVISFPVLVYLIANALWHHDGSGRGSFEEGQSDGTLAASIQAAFGKLRRLPISLSVGFLAECTIRLAEVFPSNRPLVSLPPSLATFTPVVLDGKAIKKLAKRLKPVRGTKGGVLGGRALVAYDALRGLVLCMVAHEDGHVNDVRFVPQILPEVRRAVAGPRVYVCDRQFCNLTHLPLYVMEGDHFVIRYHKKVTFCRDSTRPTRTGVDGNNRPYLEEWGWLGGAKHKGRRLVRRITLKRGKVEPVIIYTDLGVEADTIDQYPAADLLALYLERWTIERVFQQVTEVFGLNGLIGSSPKASVFQFSYCLVMYNIIQTIRAYVAEGADQAVPEVSTEKLFDDVMKELGAWNTLVGPAETLTMCADWDNATAASLRAKLTDLLGDVWRPRWRKAKRQTRRPQEHTGKRKHDSAFRILQAAVKKPPRKSEHAPP